MRGLNGEMPSVFATRDVVVGAGFSPPEGVARFYEGGGLKGGLGNACLSIVSVKSSNSSAGTTYELSAGLGGPNPPPERNENAIPRPALKGLPTSLYTARESDAATMSLKELTVKSVS